MADPYRPEPRPTGLNTPNNPYYRRDRNVRVAREEESMQAFLTSGGGSLGDQVAAILAGTTGFAIDPSDLSTMWQDSAKTTPVAAAGDPIGAIAGKWGTAPATYIQGSAPDRPLWDGAAGVFFAGNPQQFISSEAEALALFRNAPAAFLCAKVNKNTTGTAGQLGLWTANLNNVFRFSCYIDTVDRVTLLGRRIDNISGTTIVGPDADIVPTVPAVVSALIQYEAPADMRVWVDGVVQASGTLSGTPGNSSDTSSTTTRLGASSVSTNYMVGKIGRMVFCPFAPTDEQRAILEAWVNEAALAPAASNRPVDPDPIVTPL